MITKMFNEIDSQYSESVGIEIRTQDELFENEKMLVEKAKLDDLAPIETWTAL